MILGLILISSIFTTNVNAEGGNQIWLIKTKRGIDISCPYGYQYDESGSVYRCSKVNEASFTTVLAYDDLYVEEEFFNEKDILKQAIIAIKILPDVKIIEKKSSSWFGKITADIKYEIEDLKGLQRMVVFNDGTLLTMHYVSKYNGYDVADKILSSNVKLLEPSQVKELEKIQEEYTKKTQELASKKAAEDYKKKLEQEQKDKEAKKKVEEKKKAEELRKKAEAAKIKANDEKLKAKARENIQLWREKSQQLDYRFAALSGSASEQSTMNYDGLFAGFKQSIKKYEAAINNLKNTTKDKVNKVMKENELIIKQRFDVANSFLQKMEESAEFRNKAPTYKDQYEQAYGEKQSSSTMKELHADFYCKDGMFFGTLKDQDNKPVPNASIVLIYNHGNVITTASTDIDGTWQIDVSKLVFYQIKISKGGFPDQLKDVGCYQ